MAPPWLIASGAGLLLGAALLYLTPDLEEPPSYFHDSHPRAAVYDPPTTPLNPDESVAPSLLPQELPVAPETVAVTTEASPPRTAE